jgi:tape measure domain-containing protein
MAMGTIASLKIAIESGDIKRAQDELTKLGNAAGNTEKQTTTLTKSFGSLGTMITAGALVGAVAQFVKIADSMTNVNNQLKLVTKSTQELATAQDELFKIAQKTRQGYAETAAIYSNFALSMGEMGKSQKEILRVTETVNKAIAISGGTAQQAAAATMQLGQAFASGTLRGDELNSILENSKGLAQAIADGMGVPIGKLRSLGAEGKITAEILAKSLERSADSVDKKFGKVGATVDQSMAMAQNSVMKAVGEFDKLNGVSTTISKSIQDFSKYLDQNNDILDESLQLTKNLAYAAGAFYGTTLAVTAVRALTTVTAGITAMTAAQIKANIAAWANPWVILAGAIAGATYALSEYKDLQEEISLNNAKTSGSTAFLGDLKSVQGKSHKEQLSGIVARSNALKIEQIQLISTYAEHKKYAYQSSDNDKSQESRKARIMAISAEQSELVKYSNTLKGLMEVKKEDAKLPPIVDTTPKDKKEKAGKKEKTAEELAKESHDLAQKELDDIQKKTDRSKSYWEMVWAKEDEANKKAEESSKILIATENEIYDKTMQNTMSEFDYKMMKLEEEYVKYFAITGDKASLDKWLASEQQKLRDEIKPIDTSDFIKFDDDGINKHFAKIVNGFEKMDKAEKQYNKNKAKYAKGTKEYQDNEDEYQSSQIAGYANMAGAMSAMFKEGSREAAAFTAIQSALAVVEGASAVIKQLNSGDPYSAIPRAVAVGALVMSTLQNAGIAFGGGMKTSTTSDAFSAMAANEGKGSVLGDTSAQSESIAKSLDIMEELAKPEFKLISQMTASLKSIDSKIGGVTNLLLRQGGFAMGDGYEGFDTGYKNNINISSGLGKGVTTVGAIAGMGMAGAAGLGLGTWAAMGSLGPVGLAAYAIDKLLLGGQVTGMLTSIMGSVVGGLFGKTSVSQTMTDSGIYFADALLKNAKESFDGSVYQTIATTVSKKSWFSKSSSTSVSTYFTGLNDEMERQFSLVLKGLYETTIMAGSALDVSASDIDKSLDSFIVSIGKISLKGKTGTQIQETLSAIFGKIGDDIAKQAFPLLTPFQKVGEGLFETMSRVSMGMEESKYYIDRLGASFQKVKYTDIVNKQGDVGLETLRQSIISFDESVYGANNGVVKIVESISVTTSGLYDMYKLFGVMRIAITAMGQESQYLSPTMMRGAGGADELSQGISDYMDSFFSDAEKLAYSTSLMKAEFDAIGVTIPKTSDEFKNLIKSIDLSTESGQELYGRLIVLSSGFGELQDSIANSDVSKLLSDITTFVKSLRTDIVSRDASTSFQTFSESFNNMVTAIANGTSDIYAIGTKAIENAKSYLSTVTATATSGRDIAFAKAIIANKFEAVTLAPDVTMSTLNDTLKFSLNENSVIVEELRALRSEVVYLNSLNLTQTATQVKTLSATRALIA